MTHEQNRASKSTDATPPVTFTFPYDSPYDIQTQFMNHLFSILSKPANQKRFTIMQSPTGTGKTLSLICGALEWLKMAKEGKLQLQSDANHDDKIEYDEPDWVLQHDSNKRKRREEMQANKKKKVNELVELVGDGQRRRPNPAISAKKALQVHDDADLLLEGELEGSTETGISADLIKDLYKDEINEMAKEMEGDEFETPKIIYCSRTHSQITQFVKEFQKTAFKGDMTLIPLASRKNLCIHPRVKRITSSQMQMDRCQQLRSQKQCEYYDKTGLTLFTQHALNKPHDIEDLAKIGRRIEACSYFGSRKALTQADLVLMPYASLVNERMRHSLGVESLKDCVVIIDEAHNLVDAIGAVHAATLTKRQLTAALQQLNRYVERYKNRLRRGTLNKAQQLLRIMTNCLQFILSIQESKLYGINNFLYDTKIEDINLWEIQQFIDQSKLAQKLNGFIDRYKDESVEDGDELMQNCIHPTLAFLLTLSNVGSDGRLLIEKDASGKGNHSLQFLLLKPSVYFESICREAHAVVLTGGTMEPIQTVIQQLFPQEYRDSVSVFQCGHVIPDDHLLPICLTNYSTTSKFNFTMQNRNNDQMIRALGDCMVEFCRTVPGGVVCFFASYAYEELIYQKWTESGHVRQIKQTKHFFREPKQATEVDKVLEAYKKGIDSASSVANCTGSFLSCVIGGKMSEGINFSDDYGRLICIVGLPYPNKYDPALKERMNYMNQHMGPQAGSQYYQDLCMNAVNQSIGRAIRHAQDYASIVLIDERYGQQRIQSQLPRWIQDKKVRTCALPSEANGLLRAFVEGKGK